MKIRCLLVDDEPLALDVLASYVERLGGLELVGRSNNALKAFEILREEQVDLLFLDIQMPKLDGISFIKNLPSPPLVIFCTAYRDYAIEAFDLDAVDYLLKPIPFDRFLKAVGKAYRQLRPEQAMPPFFLGPNLSDDEDNSPVQPEVDHIFVRADKKMVKVNLGEVYFIESLKDYVIIHVGEKRVITKQKISYLEHRLPENKFLRIHRSFLINLQKIEAYSPTAVEIKGKELPIGRSYKNDVAKVLEI